jgi:hypothetical protein
MPITPEQLDLVGYYLNDAVRLGDLTRSDWRRQTDVVRQAFITARMFTDLGPRAVFVDGHMNTVTKMRALESGNVKAFFNRRFHDTGMKTRRIVIFDTVTTKAMGGGRGNNIARLHFHGVFEMPAGTTQAGLRKKLARVFGHAGEMGPHQFHFSPMSEEKFCSHNGVQASGPLGKVLYGIKHAGSSYRVLKLNEDGKRSRRAPAHRGADNRHSLRLARGIASNFNSDVVLIDNRSKDAGREAFEAWSKAERARANPVARAPIVAAPLPLPKVA